MSHKGVITFKAVLHIIKSEALILLRLDLTFVYCYHPPIFVK